MFFSLPARQRIHATLALISTAVGLALPLGAQAQAASVYPNKPIRLIIPYPPGGATDVIGRIVGQRLGEAIGSQVVIENRGGAGGNIGAAEVARAQADGYTLLMGALTSHSVVACRWSPWSIPPCRSSP